VADKPFLTDATGVVVDEEAFPKKVLVDAEKLVSPAHVRQPSDGSVRWERGWLAVRPSPKRTRYMIATW